jgi:hypothetical protein
METYRRLEDLSVSALSVRSARDLPVFHPCFPWTTPPSSLRLGVFARDLSSFSSQFIRAGGWRKLWRQPPWIS